MLTDPLNSFPQSKEYRLTRVLTYLPRKAFGRSFKHKNNKFHEDPSSSLQRAASAGALGIMALGNGFTRTALILSALALVARALSPDQNRLNKVLALQEKDLDADEDLDLFSLRGHRRERSQSMPQVSFLQNHIGPPERQERPHSTFPDANRRVSIDSDSG